MNDIDNAGAVIAPRAFTDGQWRALARFVASDRHVSAVWAAEFLAESNRLHRLGQSALNEAIATARNAARASASGVRSGPKALPMVVIVELQSAMDEQGASFDSLASASGYTRDWVRSVMVGKAQPTQTSGRRLADALNLDDPPRARLLAACSAYDDRTAKPFENALEADTPRTMTSFPSAPPALELANRLTSTTDISPVPPGASRPGVNHG